MNRLLSYGSTGTDVTALQCALNSALTDKSELLVLDGIFGSKTSAAVKGFQSGNGLVVDGVVGPLTWGKLKPLHHSGPHAGSCCCGHGNHVHHLHADVLKAVLATPVAPSGTRHAASAPSGSTPAVGFGGAKARKPNAAEIAILTATYGSSIDFGTVIMTNQTGVGGRAFVVAVPSPIPFVKAVQVVNIGATFSEHTLVHEFGHVWQSQHGVTSVEYMADAIVSQQAAEVANKVTGSSSYSAYAYVPGLPMSNYGAEQIAQQAANGEAAMVKHMASVTKHAIDFSMVLSAAVPRFADSSKPGVKMSGSAGKSLTF